MDDHSSEGSSDKATTEEDMAEVAEPVSRHPTSLLRPRPPRNLFYDGAFLATTDDTDALRSRAMGVAGTIVPGTTP